MSAPTDPAGRSGRALREIASALWVAGALGLAVVAIAGVASLGPVSLQQTVIYGLILMIVVLGLFCFSGLSGVLSFGHIALMAVGAYAAALLTIPRELKQTLFSDMPGFLSWILAVELGFVPATLCAGLASAVVAAFFSVPIVRISGMAASIATLAILVIAQTVLLHWDDVTRGSSSVIGVPQNTNLMNAAAWIAGLLALVAVLQGSRIGLKLRASRSDEPAAVASGVNVQAARGIAFVASGFVVGIAGALYAQFNTTFAPDQFYLELTFLVIAMLVIGGMTSLTGAVLGAIVVTSVREGLQYLQDNNIGPGGSIPDGTPEVAVAIVLILILIVRPAGIMGGKELPLPRWLRPPGWTPASVPREGEVRS